MLFAERYLTAGTDHFGDAEIKDPRIHGAGLDRRYRLTAMEGTSSHPGRKKSPVGAASRRDAVPR
jgi:hypothetical protein